MGATEEARAERALSIRIARLAILLDRKACP